jgi:NTP pyrophosphatase (non-canonical NTP hydrolase)
MEFSLSNGRFDEYQYHTGSTAIYPEEKALEYLALGAVGEAGEVAGKIKKIIRGDKKLEEVREAILDEVGDVLWYLARMCKELDSDLGVVADSNLRKLASRQSRNVIKGDGDTR